jgi:hypothetical protein
MANKASQRRQVRQLKAALCFFPWSSLRWQ